MPMERWDLTCKRCGRLFDIAVREYRSTELRREHHGSVATNNLIRVVIADEVLRGYVYQFLQSRHGRRQLLKSTDGTNQDHIEPAHVEEVLIPIPKDRSLLEGIGSKALASVEHLQESREAFTMAARRLERLWDDRRAEGKRRFLTLQRYTPGSRAFQNPQRLGSEVSSLRSCPLHFASGLAGD